MDSTPICRCRVLYLGSAVPQQSKDGLQGVQEPLGELYPERPGASAGIDSWLSVWSNGVLLENVDEAGARRARFFPISSLHYCAAVRRVSVEGAARFLPLDSPFARAPAPRRPPLFAAVLRRTHGIKVLECHAFVCRREAAANALVRCCFHAYADSSYARRLEAERAPPPPAALEELEAYDGDENHKVWSGEPEDEPARDAPRAPRPRQARPASVPPPPPPPEEPRKKPLKKTKKKSSASADEAYATMAAGRSLPRAGWPAPAVLPPGRAATLAPRHAPRMYHATVDPRRHPPPAHPAHPGHPAHPAHPGHPPALRPAHSMSGLEDDAGGIYRKKGHLNERAFSYSIRQEHRSRSHGSLASLKFAAPPEVDSGREELKKEREIMQLVGGLTLHDGPPELARRHAPR